MNGGGGWSWGRDEWDTCCRFVYVVKEFCDSCESVKHHRVFIHLMYWIPSLMFMHVSQ